MPSKSQKKPNAILTRAIKDHHMYLGIAVVVAIFVIAYTVMFIEAMKKPPLNLSVSLSGGNTYQTEPDHYVLRNRLENSVAIALNITADQESWEKFLAFSWYKTNENFCRASNFDAHNCAEDYPWEYCAIEANISGDFCYDYREKQKQKELEKQKAEEKKQQEEKRRQDQIKPSAPSKISDCDAAYSLGLEDASEANLDSEYYGHKVNYYDYMRDKSEFKSSCYSAYEKGFYANYGR